MSYVLQFFVHLFRKAGTSALRRPNATDEEQALIPSEEEPSRLRLRNQLGLTDEYVTWWQSSDAVQQCCIHVAFYLFLAVVGYSFLFENWPITDSFYFAVVIFTTVGYGDLSPSTDLSRLFTVCFAIYGIVILGIFLGIIGEWIIEKHEESREKRIANARVKIMEQFSEEDNALPPPERTFWGDTKDICISMAPIILVLVCMAAPIVYLEGWDYTMGVYWMVVTGTTIGFGDYGPTETATRCICIIYIPLAVAVLGEFLGRVAESYTERRNDSIEDRFLDRTMTVADLHKMDTNTDEKVSPDEFLSYMLVALQKVEKDDIDEIMDLFRKLDKSKTGYINKEDLVDQFQLAVRPGLTVTLAS